MSTPSKGSWFIHPLVSVRQSSISRFGVTSCRKRPAVQGLVRAGAQRQHGPLTAGRRMPGWALEGSTRPRKGAHGSETTTKQHVLKGPRDLIDRFLIVLWKEYPTKRIFSNVRISYPIAPL